MDEYNIIQNNFLLKNLLWCSLTHYSHMRSLYGSDGRFYRNEISEREFNKTNKEPFGRPECWKCEIPAAKDGGPQHVGILKDFANAVLTGSELLAPGYEGINGLTISNAIHYSAWTGGWADVKNFPDEDFYKLLKERISNSKVVKKAANITVDLTGTY